jgi:hypothetical protein
MELKTIFGFGDEKLLELILLGAYQTSWFWFFYVGSKMIQDKAMVDPFQTYIMLATLLVQLLVDQNLEPIRLGLT